MNQYRVIFNDNTRMLVTARHIDSADHFAHKKAKKNVRRIEVITPEDHKYEHGIWDAETKRGTAKMHFTTKTTCDDCGHEVVNMAKHRFENECPESAENRKKRAEESKAWDKNYKRGELSWEKWNVEDKIDFARPDYDNTPLQIAHKGKCVLVYGNGWASKGKEYKSPVLTNPTYGTVLKHFDKAIALTDDHHHIFFEGLTKISTRKGITKLEISAGS